MRLDEAYRVLDVTPSASEEEVRAAHRDLMKVWHPDRFAHDPVMQRKAEEKLKAINEAFETILAGGNPRYERTVEMTPDRREWTRVVWIFVCVFFAMAILIRRPTFGGLLIALALLILSFILTARKR